MTPTIVEITLGSLLRQHSYALRVRPTFVDLDAIARLDDVVHDVLDACLSVDAALTRVVEIEARPATILTGGLTEQELPEDIRKTIGRAMQPTDFVLPPLPNQLSMRDTSAWLSGGVSINQMFWRAR